MSKELTDTQRQAIISTLSDNEIEDINKLVEDGILSGPHIEKAPPTETLKVFVATTKTQGQRSNDFCFVPEGELVRFAMQCDGATTDDRCGCARSMGGLESHKATTTFTVAEMKMSVEEYRGRLATSLVSAHYAPTVEAALRLVKSIQGCRGFNYRSRTV